MTFKKFIFGLLGAAAGFILFSLLELNLSGPAAIGVAAASVFLGWIIGNTLAGRARKETESKKTPGFAKVIVWILVIAIIIVAIIAFVGKSIKL